MPGEPSGACPGDILGLGIQGQGTDKHAKERESGRILIQATPEKCKDAARDAVAQGLSGTGQTAPKERKIRKKGAKGGWG